MILFIFGTRPEAIKLAPVITECEGERLPYQVCVTAQHRELLDPFTDFFQINVAHDLNIMQPNQDLFELTTRAMSGIKLVVRDLKPAVVVVQGDTTTALAGAMSAFYERVPVAHVEAGLRTHDMHNPFPEEMNRKLIDHISAKLFAPTDTSRANLLSEGIADSRIEITGNTIVDSLTKIVASHHFRDAHSPVDVGSDERLITLTIHRRENFGERLHRICDAIEEIVSKRSNVQIALPVHPNPNVQNVVNERLGEMERIKLLPPLDYVAFLKLLASSDLILTDSGGVQEEAPSLGKYVLVMRDKTERPEGVESGIAELVGADPLQIRQAVDEILKRLDEANLQFPANPYGDGYASGRIVQALKDLL